MHFLNEFELKSKTLCHLNSLVLGILKIYLQEPEQNFYLYFLLKLLEFDDELVFNNIDDK